MKKKLAVLLVTVALAMLAARGLSALEIVKQYPSVWITNTQGCVMNYDLHWSVTDAGGHLLTETQDAGQAALALLTCN